MIIIAGKKKDLARRYYANVIDYLIILILTGVYIFFVSDQDQEGTYKVEGIKALLIPFVWFLYFPGSEAVFQQTIGKKAFSLYVVDLNGISPTIIQTFLRRMLDLVEIMFLGIPALITINFSERNQRIGDMVAGTTVIRTDAVCRFCAAELDLTAREVIHDSFKCPRCDQVN